jgi:ATPase subunit of ABC transporter with duplicated ATPase domains
VLSGGERARLRLLLLKLLAPSLLFLDEPTNHLDIGGIEALEHSLRAEGVSCIFVSHDRRFVEAVATRELVIERQE